MTPISLPAASHRLRSTAPPLVTPGDPEDPGPEGPAPGVDDESAASAPGPPGVAALLEPLPTSPLPFDDTFPPDPALAEPGANRPPVAPPPAKAVVDVGVDGDSNTSINWTAARIRSGE